MTTGRINQIATPDIQLRRYQVPGQYRNCTGSRSQAIDPPGNGAGQLRVMSFAKHQPLPRRLGPEKVPRSMKLPQAEKEMSSDGSLDFRSPTTSPFRGWSLGTNQDYI